MQKNLWKNIQFLNKGSDPMFSPFTSFVSLDIDPVEVYQAC